MHLGKNLTKIIDLLLIVITVQSTCSKTLSPPPLVRSSPIKKDNCFAETSLKHTVLSLIQILRENIREHQRTSAHYCDQNISPFLLSELPPEIVNSSVQLNYIPMSIRSSIISLCFWTVFLT